MKLHKEADDQEDKRLEDEERAAFNLQEAGLLRALGCSVQKSFQIGCTHSIHLLQLLLFRRWSDVLEESVDATLLGSQNV